MENTDTVIAVFADHPAAEAAIKKLTGAGFGHHYLLERGDSSHTSVRAVGGPHHKAAPKMRAISGFVVAALLAYGLQRQD